MRVIEELIVSLLGEFRRLIPLVLVSAVSLPMGGTWLEQ